MSITRHSMYTNCERTHTFALTLFITNTKKQARKTKIRAAFSYTKKQAQSKQTVRMSHTFKTNKLACKRASACIDRETIIDCTKRAPLSRAKKRQYKRIYSFKPVNLIVQVDVTERLHTYSHYIYLLWTIRNKNTNNTCTTRLGPTPKLGLTYRKTSASHSQFKTGLPALKIKATKLELAGDLTSINRPSKYYRSHIPKHRLLSQPISNELVAKTQISKLRHRDNG